MRFTRESKCDYWRNTINEWETSNETQVAFCDRKGIKLHNFTKWRHQLKADQLSKEESGNGFIEATVISSPTSDTNSHLSYTLNLGDSIVLTIPSTSTTSQLQTLFRALKVIT